MFQPTELETRIPAPKQLFSLLVHFSHFPAQLATTVDLIWLHIYQNQPYFRQQLGQFQRLPNAPAGTKSMEDAFKISPVI